MILLGINHLKLATIPTVTILYLLMFTPGAMQVQAATHFDTDYDHECSDAKTSDPLDRHTSQPPPNDQSHHSLDFMDNYKTGLYACHDDQDNGGDGNSETQSIIQPQFSSQNAR